MLSILEHIPGLKKLLNTETKEQQLPDDEVAKIIRQSILDLIEIGVVGSDEEIPSEPHKKAVKLPVLLRYSTPVKQHFATLKSILSAPREFRIVDAQQVGQIWEGDPDGDALKTFENKNVVYYIANHLTSGHVNAWAAALEGLRNMKPLLYVSILKDNHKGGVWKLGYYYLEWFNPLSPRLIGSTELRPERQTTLEFWFSPQRMTPDEMLQQMYISPNLRDHLSVGSDEIQDGFRRVLIAFDAERYANTVEESREVNDQHLKKARFLRDRGNYRFAIVELGVKTIGGQQFWVYSGSETDSIQVQVSEKQPAGVAKLVPAVRTAFTRE